LREGRRKKASAANATNPRPVGSGASTLKVPEDRTMISEGITKYEFAKSVRLPADFWKAVRSKVPE
jgi:hypothetical protein